MPTWIRLALLLCRVPEAGRGVLPSVSDSEGLRASLVLDYAPGAKGGPQTLRRAKKACAREALGIAVSIACVCAFIGRHGRPNFLGGMGRNDCGNPVIPIGMVNRAGWFVHAGQDQLIWMRWAQQLQLEGTLSSN